MESTTACTSATADAEKCAENARKITQPAWPGEITEERLNPVTPEMSETVDSQNPMLVSSSKCSESQVEISSVECVAQTVASIAKQSPTETGSGKREINLANSLNRADFHPAEATANKTCLIQTDSTKHFETAEQEAKTMNSVEEEQQQTNDEPRLESLKAVPVAEQSQKLEISEKSLLGEKPYQQLESSAIKEQLEEPPCKKLKADNHGTFCEESVTGETMAKVDFQFDAAPRQLTGAWKCFSSNKDNNYLRGCKWAPDGTCLLTNSNDNCLRLFNLPEQLYLDGGENQVIAEMSPVLKMQESGTIYDYSWYPNMSSADPVTACLAVCSKDTPIHLFDAFSGEIRCSYRPYNHVDELVAPHCVSFDPDGDKLYCGFNKTVRVFDVTRPGRECQSRPTFAKSGQRGIISCIAHSPSEPGLYAAGSFSRTIALYQEPQGEMMCMFEGQQGGVTQVHFSPDGSKLYSGGRKDDEILCWDLRNPGRILFTLLRSVRTNQRMYFDISLDGRYVVSGSNNGTVLVWDITKPAVTSDVLAEPVLQPVMMYQAHTDAVNGISLHPSLPMIATCSGQRHFPMFDSDSEDDSVDPDQIDNSVRLWWVRDSGVR